MIKIIKQGYIPEYLATCPKCKCEFEFDARDFERQFNTSGELETLSTFVRCPCCGNRINKYHKK